MNIRFRSLARFICVLAAVVGWPTTSFAQVKVIISGGFNAANQAVLPDFERTTGAKTHWRSTPVSPRLRSQQLRTIGYGLAWSGRRCSRVRSSAIPAFWYFQAGWCQPKRRHNTACSRQRA